MSASEDSNAESSSGIPALSNDPDRASSSRSAASSPVQEQLIRTPASTATSSRKKKLNNMAFEVPEELNLRTPPHESAMKRKHRHQKIRRYWEKEYKNNRYVTEYWRTQFEAKAAKKAERRTKKSTPQKSKVETAKRKERPSSSSRAAQVEEPTPKRVRIAIRKKPFKKVIPQDKPVYTKSSPSEDTEEDIEKDLPIGLRAALIAKKAEEEWEAKKAEKIAKEAEEKERAAEEAAAERGAIERGETEEGTTERGETEGEATEGGFRG